MNVRKTNGSVEEFDNQKVKDSICRAYEAAGEPCDELILKSIVGSLFLYDNINSSEIRRQVENALMSINKKVAKSFTEKYADTKDIRKKQDFIKEYIAASNAATGSKFDSCGLLQDMVQVPLSIYILLNIFPGLPVRFLIIDTCALLL